MARRVTAFQLLKRLRGPPVRPKQVHKDAKKTAKRKACRRKPQEDE